MVWYSISVNNYSIVRRREVAALRGSAKLGDAQQVQRIYYQIIVLGTLLHLSHAVIFSFLSHPYMALYNCGSFFFYLGMLVAAYRGMYRLVVSSVHIEVCLFVIINTLLGGWELGLPLYLIAVSSLVYFCPFEHKYIPYLFSVAEMGIFLWLRHYTRQVSPYYQHVSELVRGLLYSYSAVASFSIVLCAAFFSNISASVTNRRLQDENQSLAARANFDDLTGLMSRRFFLERVAQVPQEVEMSVALGDIDDFKLINDTYGHATGDYVLRTVSKLIGQTCSHRVLVCRWGGEEFVFCFPDMSAAQAVQELRLLSQAVEQHVFTFQGSPIFPVTLTIGLAEKYPGSDIDTLISKADARMYHGKLHGKKQLVSSDQPPERP